MKIKMYQNNSYINSLGADNFYFCEFPKKKSARDYEQVIEKIRSLCRHKSVKSAYTFGDINTPGISDIDLIFEIKRSDMLPEFLKKRAIDFNSRYVLYHPYWIVPEGFMKDFNYIYPNSDLKQIYGEKPKIKKPNKTELNLVYKHLTNDIILNHFPSDYFKPLLTRKIKVREALLRMNALIHSFGMYKKLSKKSNRDWDEFSKEIKLLRKNWFSIPIKSSKHKLAELLKKAVYTSLNFNYEFSKLLECGGYHAEFKGIRNSMLFVKNWDAVYSISETIRRYNKNRKIYSVLHGKFAAHLFGYVQYKGPLSSYISKRINGYEAVKPDRIFSKRVQMLNSQVNFAVKLKHQHFSCFFDYGFKSTVGLKNKIIYSYVAARESPLVRRLWN